jgi:ADP-heptose:LPS heptosyltransferase
LIVQAGLPRSFLIIQTAFIGDVILATALVEKLKRYFPEAPVDFLLRKGNESLLAGHPHLREVIIWDKKKDKLKNLFRLIRVVKTKKYDCVVNVHRFASSGLITALSGAPWKIGFDKNPLSFFFTHRVRHDIRSGKHETERNQELISLLTDARPARPVLYPSAKDFEKAKTLVRGAYICLAPASVWFTKQFPAEKWIEFLNTIADRTITIILVGAATDKQLCAHIKDQTKKSNVINLAGELSFLESAALMKGAAMNYVNDSAPLHIASAVNAPVTAVFCSTVPSFGFGPLSSQSYIIETKEKLDCRPCGLHGYRACPKAHFKCAAIPVQDLVNTLPV